MSAGTVTFGGVVSCTVTLKVPVIELPAVGHLEKVAPSELTVLVTGSTQPGAAQKAYADYYPRYRALYPALAGEFAAMADVVAKTM